MWIALSALGLLVIVGVGWIWLDKYLEVRTWNQSLKRLTKDLE